MRTGSGNKKRRPAKTLRKRRGPQQFNVVVERDEDGWLVGSVPELHGCHTQARTMESLMDRIREAIALCLEVEGNQPRSEFVAIARVTVDA